MDIIGAIHRLRTIMPVHTISLRVVIVSPVASDLVGSHLLCKKKKGQLKTWDPMLSNA